jgi:hypothetical protein
VEPDGERVGRGVDSCKPVPLAGEAAARSAAGEGLGGEVLRGGWGSRGPSPGNSLRSLPSSPVKGEGQTETGVILKDSKDGTTWEIAR